jgi:hypothetical protein
VIHAARVAFLAAAVAVGLAFAAAPTSAAATPSRHAFKVLISPADATAGEATTFQVSVVNSSSSGVLLKSVQLSPPTGFTLSHTVLPPGLRRKATVRPRMLALHQIMVDPGTKLQIPVRALASAKCGKVPLRWASHAFEKGNGKGPQLTLQSMLSRLSVTVLCPSTAVCGDGGPPCSTDLSTSPSTYAVMSNASSGTLRETVNVGKRLICRGYKPRDANWYDALVAQPSAQPPPSAAAPPVDLITYKVRGADANGIGFCLGAAYEFTTASGTPAPKATLPTGASGFLGLLPMCSNGKPPCISNVSESADAHAKSGVDTTINVVIPEGPGDPWGGA